MTIYFVCYHISVASRLLWRSMVVPGSGRHT